MSLEEKIDTSSAAEEFIFHIFSAIAHFEKKLFAEHTKESVKVVPLRGK